MMKTITLEYLKSINACYWWRCGGPFRVADVEALLPATPLEFAEFNLPPQDLLWLFLREDFIPESDLRYLARQFALSVVDKWDCPPIVRQWLETGDESVRAAARSAARAAAAWSAWAASSAYSASSAWAAAWAASSAYSASSASSAARAAYSAAAAWSAWSAAAADSSARRSQLELVKAKLREVAK